MTVRIPTADSGPERAYGSATTRKKFVPWEHVVGTFDGEDHIVVVVPDRVDTLPHEVAIYGGADLAENVWVDSLRLATDAEMLNLARISPSESGHGWTLDMAYPFWPGMPCVHCGKFVGRRDGVFNVEHFEMSNTIASLDAEHRGCPR